MNNQQTGYFIILTRRKQLFKMRTKTKIVYVVCIIARWEQPPCFHSAPHV